MSEAASWTIEQVVAIAPTPSRFAAAEGLAVPARWVSLGADARSAWGRCRGTGREPYDTMVDHANVAWRCSCPSRSHPCKHALALLIMWVRGHVPAAPAPAGVSSWVDGHTPREPVAPDDRVAPGVADPDEASGADDAPTDGAADLERARDERVERLRSGLVELDRWLDDRLRTGLADPALARYATWDDLAARLVDARAGALANRVRRLAGVVGARPDWHEVVLAELGVMHLLAQAGQRVPELPGALADAVATSCGWQVRQADVLAGVPDTDTWVVAGRSDTREDRIEVRRTWLRGRASGRWAMILSFAAYRQSLDDSLPVGRALTADLHRYPGPSSRALVGTVHDDGSDGGAHAPPAGTVADACAAIGTVLAAEPWIDRVPATLLATPTPSDDRWVLTDHTGALALVRDAPGLAALVAASAGRPVAVTVEWTVDGAVPLSVHLPDRVLDIGPRAEHLVRERGVTVTDHWHELVTVSLLGTDRRDPPEPPPGPLADVVADALATSPSERMLAAVGACVAARRAGLLPLPAVPVLAPPEPDDRPLLPVAAARRWGRIVVEWPVLEDEWLQEVERRGWQLAPDVLVGLLRRHRTDTVRRARVVRLGGPVVGWLCELQPELRPVARRSASAVDMGLPGLAVPPPLLPLLEAPPEPVIAAVLSGFLDGSFGRSHRAVLVNFVARTRPDGLPALAEALRRVDPPADGVGLARSLAELATTRHEMLQELCEPGESASERTRRRGEPSESASERTRQGAVSRASERANEGEESMNQQTPATVLRPHAETQYAAELVSLAAADDRPRPPNWNLSPWAVVTYLLGGVLSDGTPISPKYVGQRRMVEIAVATLATDRALLLLGVPGTAKTWVSEHLAAAISGDSTLLVQGTAGTTEESLRYGWNYARLLAEGPSEAALVPSPVYRAMRTGRLVRVEELTRMPSEVQDALVTILSEKVLPVPELDTEVAAVQGFNLIATANDRDRGINELSSALRRRFNTVVLPLPATAEEEMAIVAQRVAELGTALALPEVPATSDEIRRVVTIFRELREGVTADGRTSLKTPTGTLSTAEAISVVTNGLALAAHFGDGVLRPGDLAGGIVGAVVRDPLHDEVAWREYLEGVVRDRAGWDDFYDACRRLS